MPETTSTPTAAGEAAEAAAQPDTRTPEEIAADIEATRARLAGSVDELAEAANPVALAESAVGRVKHWFVDPETGPRMDRIGKVAATVVALVVVRRIVRRGS